MDLHSGSEAIDAMDWSRRVEQDRLQGTRKGERERNKQDRYNKSRETEGQ